MQTINPFSRIVAALRVRNRLRERHRPTLWRRTRRLFRRGWGWVTKTVLKVVGLLKKSTPVITGVLKQVGKLLYFGMTKSIALALSLVFGALKSTYDYTLGTGVSIAGALATLLGVWEIGIRLATGDPDTKLGQFRPSVILPHLYTALDVIIRQLAQITRVIVSGLRLFFSWVRDIGAAITAKISALIWGNPTWEEKWKEAKENVISNLDTLFAKSLATNVFEEKGFVDEISARAKEMGYTLQDIPQEALNQIVMPMIEERMPNNNHITQMIDESAAVGFVNKIRDEWGPAVKSQINSLIYNSNNNPESTP